MYRNVHKNKITNKKKKKKTHTTHVTLQKLFSNKLYAKEQKKKKKRKMDLGLGFSLFRKRSCDADLKYVKRVKWIAVPGSQ